MKFELIGVSLLFYLLEHLFWYMIYSSNPNATVKIKITSNHKLIKQEIHVLLFRMKFELIGVSLLFLFTGALGEIGWEGRRLVSRKLSNLPNRWLRAVSPGQKLQHGQ